MNHQNHQESFKKNSNKQVDSPSLPQTARVKICRGGLVIPNSLGGSDMLPVRPTDQDMPQHGPDRTLVPLGALGEKGLWSLTMSLWMTTDYGWLLGICQSLLKVLRSPTVKIPV